MPRRDLTLGLAAAGLLPALPALAQGAPAEGKDFVRLSQPVPMAASGKVEVVEFFWYGCPHCNAMEPSLEAWVRKLPADVSFRRMPVGFTPVHELHQRLFYTLEALGQLEAVHRKVFAAIHVQRRNLNSEAALVEFAGSVGLDAARFSETLKSFSVSGKARQAKQMTAAFRIDGVPALGVHGRFYTSAALTGSHERAFAVTDWLIQQVRKAGV
ncbi:thiol:disulfide interchange protein DsbA/DsbL [Ideonella sp. TBM-1]|uniref:Thiol:disulfide interchange protein n=1 Tax=Ideonella livida TaxID=2707176 RepID=A0A7C9PJW6_9BURK|nr:thiol:disulfide interchange protein DsbA/DsbL [Ideonella livida]